MDPVHRAFASVRPPTPAPTMATRFTTGVAAIIGLLRKDGGRYRTRLLHDPVADTAGREPTLGTKNPVAAESTQAAAAAVLASGNMLSPMHPCKRRLACVHCTVSQRHRGPEGGSAVNSPRENEVFTGWRAGLGVLTAHAARRLVVDSSSNQEYLSQPRQETSSVFFSESTNETFRHHHTSGHVLQPRGVGTKGARGASQARHPGRTGACC